MLVPKRRRGLLIILIFFLMTMWSDDVWNFLQGKEYPPFQQELIENDSIIITTRAQKHILQGDDHGGGHLYGTGKPCKSEFPEEWDSVIILSTIKKVAANDNVDWKQQINGYYIGEQSVNGVRVRVVLDNDKESVVTAYPVNLPRNPCPDPANDNQSR